MGKLRVMLIDDHAIVREGLKAMISGQADMEVVAEAADGAAALDLVRAAAPDVVVTDLSMAGLGGTEVARRLRQDHPGVKVVALTVHEDKGYLHQLLAAGASGYVLKLTAPDELVRALRVVAAGGVYLDPAMAGKLVAGMARRPGAEPADPAAGLSDRETEVVRLTAAGYGNKEIATRLDLSVKTIETYRARAMEKLDLTGRADLVRYAVRNGWLKDD